MCVISEAILNKLQLINKVYGEALKIATNFMWQ